MPLTIALLDRLDARLDRIIININRTIGPIDAKLLADWWGIGHWIDAKRRELEPMVIYPQPAPIIGCKHPPDMDYCGQYYDPEQEHWRLWCGCRVCGTITMDVAWPPGQKKKRKSKKK